MKRILLFLIFISNFCHAQNYQCLQSGVKHYFINGNNYLRGIRIDSTKTLGDTTIYYPYKTTRFYPSHDTAGSWLGGRVIQLPTGTFLFDDIWGDTVYIKTQAATGDSWLFYSDTVNNTYIATVISEDTMTISGSVDSIKNIVIKSYHGGINDTLDPVNNFNIILSQNNGFAEIFDLYTFPYYSASTPYTGEIDPYLSIVCGASPTPFNSEFNVVSYQIPTTLNMYNFNVGDMFAGNYGAWPQCPEVATVSYIHYDSIISKTIIDSFHVDYAIHHLINGTYSHFCFGCSVYPYIYDYIDTLHTDTSLVFLTQMPEEYMVPYMQYYYYPFDTSFCHLSPAYKSTEYIFEGCPFEADFKQGFLPTYDTPICPTTCNSSATIGYSELIEDFMFYALVNDSSCNSLILPSLTVNTVAPAPANTIVLFPNPASTYIIVQSSSLSITRVSITNLIGQTVYSGTYNSDNVQIDISHLPPGLYLTRINGSEIRKFVKD